MKHIFKRGFAGALVLVLGAVVGTALMGGGLVVKERIEGLQNKVVELSDLVDAQQRLVQGQSEQTEELFGAFNPVGGQIYYLSGGGISSSDTSISLTAFKTPVSNYPLQMTDFGSIGFLTLEPGSATRQEFISFTGITQNADGTATLTGVTRGLSPVYPFTASTTIRKAHAGGSSATLSNPPQFYQQFVIKANEETITGTLSGPTPTASGHFATKGYVDGIALGGATVDKIVVAATAGETVSAGQIVYFDTIQDEWMKADADTAASSTGGIMLGIAQGAGTDGNTITGGVLLKGLDTNNTGGTQGNIIYISNTAGATSTSAGTFSRAIGIIRTSAGMYFDPYFVGLSASSNNAFTGTNSFATTSFSGPLTLTGSATSTIASSSVLSWTASTTPGTVWTKPSNLKYIKVQVVGAGGTGGQYAGGGGGAWCIKTIPAAALASTETVNVGKTSGAVNSSFGSFITAAKGSDAGATSNTSGGSGGTCSGSYDYTVPGQNGGGAPAYNTGWFAGGPGGNSALGLGGAIQGCTGNGGAVGGQSGVGPGAGGGGGAAACDGSPDSTSATAGNDGAVIVEQFFY